MPKYSFECPNCKLTFSRMLKVGEHPDHPCPKCKGAAKRHWHGQGVSFNFQPTPGTDQGNSGVTKDDYPTADHLVGRTADQRWGHIRERDAAKAELRQKTGTHALRRQNGPGFIDYTSMDEGARTRRRETAREALAAQEAVNQDS